MTTTSSDGSGDCEKQQKELNQSYASSVLDYSEDTWEPFSEEEVASCQHESKSSELYCSTENTKHSAVLDPGESMLMAGQSHTGMESLLSYKPISCSFRSGHWRVEFAKKKKKENWMEYRLGDQCLKKLKKIIIAMMSLFMLHFYNWTVSNGLDWTVWLVKISFYKWWGLLNLFFWIYNNILKSFHA